MFELCFLLAMATGLLIGALIAKFQGQWQRQALLLKYAGIKANNVTVADFDAATAEDADGDAATAEDADRKRRKRELLRAAERVVQYVLYQVYLSEKTDPEGATLIDQDASKFETDDEHSTRLKAQRLGEPCGHTAMTREACVSSQKQRTAALIRQFCLGDANAQVGDAINASLMSKSSDGAQAREFTQRRLFPGINRGLKEYKRDTNDDKQERVVARNHDKGGCYEVCLDANPADPAAGLNKVEHVVSVLLHEVAHTIHYETCKCDVHNQQFHDIYDFLVRTARCVLRNGDAPLKTGRVEFNVDTFEEACGPNNRVYFCGVTVPLSRCDGECGEKKKKKGVMYMID